MGIGLGAAAGATSPGGFDATRFDGALGDDDRSKYASSSMGRLDELASGKAKYNQQGMITRLTSGDRARVEGAADNARARATERSIERGEGGRSGMLDKRLAEIDREQIGATRQTTGPLMAQLAKRAPQLQLQATGQMLPFIQGQDQMAMQDHSRMQEAAAANKAAGSWYSRMFAGAAAAA